MHLSVPVAVELSLGLVAVASALEADPVGAGVPRVDRAVVAWVGQVLVPAYLELQVMSVPYLAVSVAAVGAAAAVVATSEVSVAAVVAADAGVAAAATEVEILVTVPAVSLSFLVVALAIPLETFGRNLKQKLAVAASAAASPAVFEAELQYDLASAADHLAET